MAADWLNVDDIPDEVLRGLAILALKHKMGIPEVSPAAPSNDGPVRFQADTDPLQLAKLLGYLHRRNDDPRNIPSPF